MNFFLKIANDQIFYVRLFNFFINKIYIEIE